MNARCLKLAIVLLGSSIAPGCYGTACEEDARLCTPGDGAAGEGGEGGTGGDGGGDVGGSGGEGGGTPPGCEPIEDEPIGTGCGVYVASGATGDGAQLSPYGTVTQAVAELGSAKRIYICGGETFTGSIDLPSDVSIYGGMDCAAWVFRSANPKPEIAGDADMPAIAISGSEAGTLSFLRVTAADAVQAGESSIAVLVTNADTLIRGCELVARSGATGAPGEAEAKAVTPALANGGPGGDGCLSMPGTFGGAGGQNTCQSTPVSGGLGGQGTNDPTNGGNADDGEPISGATGQGGKRQDGTQCGNGTQGSNGFPGAAGAGASSAQAGELSATGYQAPMAPGGVSGGEFGQGGGGGGGANQCGAMGAGPSGGGGGAGGCGGNPGAGGQGGGGSFALISIGASVSLESVTLTSGSGGTGGVGDAGQPGMDGGSGGNSGDPADACNGGPGGNGGQGGAGGGGRGGPSVGIAYVGEAPIETGTIDITVAATPATGGLGGNGGGANIGGTGADGLTELRQQWP